MNLRIGLGRDIHRLEEGRPLYLGGVEIPHPRGLCGHSDGDVLIHAVIDALLGALGEGDIGNHFPDTDPEIMGIRSLELLRRVMKWIESRRAVILHLDSVVSAERPRLAPYVPEIRRTLAGALGIDTAAVSVKAKTNEGLGEIGREEAMEAWAAVLIEVGTADG